MNLKHVGLATFAIVTLFALIASPLFAAPVTFEGTDAGAGPASARPNSDAAAANFDAAAAVLGTINLVNFETAPPGDFSSLVIAPGVTVTMQGTDAGTGIRTDAGNATEGYNTTGGGVRRIGFWPTFNIGTARMIFDFSQPIEAFGSYLTGLGTANGNLFVLFNDGSNQSIPVVGGSTGGAKFFGFTDANASIVQVVYELRNVTGNRDIYGLDDLRFVSVPEPTTIFLGVWLLLARFGFDNRRRRR